MMSQIDKQIITVHMLPNISSCKDNQTMKFSQFIEYNMIVIFLEKSYTKCGGENRPTIITHKIFETNCTFCVK